MITAYPGYDEIILTTSDRPRLCHSRACSQVGRLAQVIVTYGVLADRRAWLMKKSTRSTLTKPASRSARLAPGFLPT